MNPHDDVLIIGGGVIGACAAYYLSGKGLSVALMERDEIASGCSGGNAGLVVPSHSIPLAAPGVLAQGLRWLLDARSPFYVRLRLDRDLSAWLWRFLLAAREARVRRGTTVLRDLHMASRNLFDELAAGAGLEFGYRQGGALLVCISRRGLEKAQEEARLLGEFGVVTQAMDSAQVRDLVPNLQPAVVGGVYYPQDAHFDPALFVQQMAAKAEEAGARIWRKTEVLGLEVDGKRVRRVRTTRGDFFADTVILAAGSWSPGVARGLQLRLPIQAAKGYSLSIAWRERSPAVPLLLGEARVVTTPLGGVLRLGGTLELVGMDLSINDRRVQAIHEAAKRYVGGLEAIDVVEIWRGLRPCAPDGLPLIGRTRAYENLIVATGHGMLGMSLGPVTGRLVMQLVCGEEADVDLAPLSPDRF